ncbi:trypsin Inhibitor like cysteine rich domain protein [Ancylostoma ceylanicum]|uniref:Trypsin Inhibitor like cysteine rich domain protein n=1 Tax=Ancylostoma ceylanicum TaxID=53326 RepID=A0A0D6LUM1_9BILA|nr:trypsin Inhibitor like cysteine rich domain protein [Ancylostoma ceylanicum]
MSPFYAVKIVEAMPKCGPNERLEACGNLKECEPTCDGEDKICPRGCYGGSVCVCEEGFYRDRAGDCVTDEDCAIWDDMEFITLPPQ